MNIMRLIAIMILLSAVPVFASQEFYVPPRSVNLKLSPAGVTETGHVFNAELQSLVGTVKNIRCFFESSVGSVTFPLEQSEVAALAKDAVHQASFTVSLTPEQAGDSKNWVRFRVEYLPDYHEIEKQVNDNAKTYSDQGLRDQLLEIIHKSNTGGARAVDAIRHFFKK